MGASERASEPPTRCQMPYFTTLRWRRKNIDVEGDKIAGGSERAGVQLYASGRSVGRSVSVALDLAHFSRLDAWNEAMLELDSGSDWEEC